MAGGGNSEMRELREMVAGVIEEIRCEIKASEERIRVLEKLVGPVGKSAPKRKSASSKKGK